MKEIAEALKVLFDKISGFFDIFDLSFFVSGAVSLCALIFAVNLSGKPVFEPLQGGFRIAAMILFCYVSGLFCFAVGRWIRMTFQNVKDRTEFNEQFMQIINAHGLALKEPFKDYIERASSQSDARVLSRLYVRLWAEIRQIPDLAPSLILLKRYWVMAATYDGLAVAILTWALVIGTWCFGFGINSKLNLNLGLLLIAGIAVTAIACIREAGRYEHYQREELVATMTVYLGHKEDKRDCGKEDNSILL